MQKIILLVVMLLSGFIFGQVKPKEQQKMNTVTVKISNALTDKGKMHIAVYDKISFFKKPLFGKISEIKNGVSKVVFKNIPKGIYAVVCYHDENNNNKLDFDERGIPIENYGNTGEMAMYGPPTFENSKIVIEEDKTVVIEL